MPCGGPEFIPKEYLSRHLVEWCASALRKIGRDRLAYRFLNSHYWDAGLATRELSQRLGVPHLHTPHSLGVWKKRQMQRDFPQSSHEFERLYNFRERIDCERQLYEDSHKVIATSPLQTDLLRQDYQLPAGA